MGTKNPIRIICFRAHFLNKKMYHEKSIEESKPASRVLLETNVSKKNTED
jgi:hypothetical protein